MKPCDICGRTHMGADLSCNESRLVEQLLVDLKPLVEERCWPALLVILTHDVRTARR